MVREREIYVYIYIYTGIYSSYSSFPSVTAWGTFGQMCLTVVSFKEATLL